MEKMALNNVAAGAGASGTARTTAGLPAFLIPTQSVVQVVLTVLLQVQVVLGFQTLLQLTEHWNNHRDTSKKSVIASCGMRCRSKRSSLRIITEANYFWFTGNATRFKEAEDS